MIDRLWAFKAQPHWTLVYLSVHSFLYVDIFHQFSNAPLKLFNPGYDDVCIWQSIRQNLCTVEESLLHVFSFCECFSTLSDPRHSTRLYSLNFEVFLMLIFQTMLYILTFITADLHLCQYWFIMLVLSVLLLTYFIIFRKVVTYTRDAKNAKDHSNVVTAYNLSKAIMLLDSVVHIVWRIKGKK